MIRFILIFFFILPFFSVNAQVSTPSDYWQMQLEKDAELMRIQDSVQHAQDSLQMLWVNAPMKNRPNQFLDSLKEVYTVKDGQFIIWKKKFANSSKYTVQIKEKAHRSRWSLWAFGVILFLFSLIKIFYTPQLKGIILGFYDNNVFIQLNKEEGLFNRWPFILLFMLFSFVVGLFFFLGARTYLSVFYNPTIQLFFLLSGVVFVLILLKVLATKALGYIFEVGFLSREYISILYLCYFNGAIYLLPVLLAFLFLPSQFIDGLFFFSCLLLMVLFLLQFLRVSIFTLKTHKFSKFYLFLYFCALEIGPLLILIKILDYNLK